MKKQQIEDILKDEPHRIEHIGSTSIPHMQAKPTIDIMITLTQVEKVFPYVPGLESLNYLYGGEFGLSGRHFFCKGNAHHCQFHLHVYGENNSAISDHRSFKRYLIAHPKTREAYIQLKQALSKRYPHDRAAYTSGKHEFIQRILKLAKSKN